MADLPAATGYPGKLHTPTIEVGSTAFWRLPWEEQQRLRRVAQERHAAYMRTWRGKLETMIYCWRIDLANWIAPEGWDDE